MASPPIQDRRARPKREKDDDDKLAQGKALVAEDQDKDGITKLHIAASKGELTKVRELLGQIGLDTLSKRGNTPLHFAAQQGHKEVVDTLLAAGASPDISNHHEYRPLHIAAQEGKKHIVLALLDKGAAIDSVTRDGNSALHLASRNGHEDVVRALLERGAKIAARTYTHQNTPLHLAARDGRKTVVDTLLQQGAKTDIDIQNIHGYTALHFAAQQNKKDVVETLLARRADTRISTLKGVFARDMAGSESVKAVFDRPKPVNRFFDLKERGLKQVGRPAHPDRKGAKWQVLQHYDARVTYCCEGHIQPQRYKMNHLIYSDFDISTDFDEALKEAPFRWIHLPFNNMVWVKDLIQQLCYAQHISIRHCEELQVFAQGEGRVVKGSGRQPHFHTELHAKDGHGEHLVSMSIPFLDTESTCSFRNDFDRRRQEIEDAYRPSDVHITQTLDQYYYDGIHGVDTTDRDQDQVLAKVMPRRTLSLHDDLAKHPGQNVDAGAQHRSNKPAGDTVAKATTNASVERQTSHRKSTPRDQNPAVLATPPRTNSIAKLVKGKLRRRQRSTSGVSRGAGVETAGDDPKQSQSMDSEYSDDPDGESAPDMPPMQLMVSQLWLWQIDKHTVITCFPDRLHNRDASVSRSLFNWLAQGFEGLVSRPNQSSVTAEDFIKMVATWSMSFSVEPNNAGLLEPAQRWFSRYIAQQAGTEVDRRLEFERSMNDGAKINDLRKEMECLREIKDVREEIVMVQSVLKKQRQIMKLLWDTYEAPDTGRSSFDAQQAEMSFIFERWEALDEDAKRVEKSLHRLLDFKQKKASLDEAASAALQAKWVIVFSVVTVVFTPMAFITSLFALDIFKQAKEEDHEYRVPGWDQTNIDMALGAGEAVTLGVITIVGLLVAVKANWKSLKNKIRNELWPRLKYRTRIRSSEVLIRKRELKFSQGEAKIGGRPPSETIKTINACLGVDEALDARPLPSGDVMVRFEKGAQRYKQDRRWVTSAFGDDAVDGSWIAALREMMERWGKRLKGRK